MKEKKLNYIINKSLNIFTSLIFVAFAIPILLHDKYEYNPQIYIPILTLHIIQFKIYVDFILGLQNYLNIFFLEILHFFSMKFDCLNQRIKKLESRSDKFENKKLSKLIFEFNQVYLECLKINDLFKHFIGFNFVFFFLINVNMTFSSLYADIRHRVAISLVFFSWFMGNFLLLKFLKF